LSERAPFAPSAVLRVDPAQALRSEAQHLGHVVGVLVATAREVDEDVLVLGQAGRHAHGPGHGVGANDVEAVLRSLPTLALRYAAQDRSARALAQWCSSRPAFVRVLHPALPDSPGHEHWRTHCRAAAGLVTVELDPRWSVAQADAFIDALRLFRIGWSWGGPVSLAAPYQAAEIRRLATPYRGTLVRFCLGLEAVDDLLADVEQALRVSGLG